MNGESATTLGECLSEETLSEYLEGTLAPVVKNACEVHLVACDPCRENLALFMRVLGTEVNAEEQARLENVLAQWERRNLQPVPAPKARRTGFRNWYTLAAIAAALVLAVVATRRPSEENPSPGDIVRFLLEKDRPFEARMAGQAYLPIVLTRSPQTSSQYGLLAEAMTEQSADAYQMGQIFLIQRDFDQAVQYLEKAAADPNAPAEVHNDLGVAYLELGGDRGVERAEQELSLAVAKNPRFGPAVFNLTLLYGRRDMTAATERERRRYLELDPSSEWAQEISRKFKTEPGKQ